jgi:ribonuclease P protein component
MLPKRHRFSFKEKLPKNIYHSQSFNVRYGANADELKVAVVVSRQVHKKAAIRNKIKRNLLKALADKINKDRRVNLIFYIKRKALDIANYEDELEQVIDLIEEL